AAPLRLSRGSWHRWSLVSGRPPQNQVHAPASGDVRKRSGLPGLRIRPMSPYPVELTIGAQEACRLKAVARSGVPPFLLVRIAIQLARSWRTDEFQRLGESLSPAPG